MSKKLSVIIPLYNYQDVIEKAVRSAAITESNEIEIIVINDGSTDNSKDVALELADKISFRFYDKKNEGLAKTRNFGIEKSIGDYIVFLDADDFFLESALEQILQDINDFKGALLVYGHESIHPDGAKKYLSAPPQYQTREKAFSEYGLGKCRLSSGSVAFPRAFFDEVCFPSDLRHAEDLPVYALALAKLPLHVSDQATCAVVKHANSMRKDASAALLVGEKGIDFLFEHPALPVEFKKYHQVYLVRRCQSIFRTVYRSGRYEDAVFIYRKLIRNAPNKLFDLKLLFRFIRAIFLERIEKKG